jgi:hypothetical protein
MTDKKRVHRAQATIRYGIVLWTDEPGASPPVLDRASRIAERIMGDPDLREAMRAWIARLWEDAAAMEDDEPMPCPDVAAFRDIGDEYRKRIADAAARYEEQRRAWLDAERDLYDGIRKSKADNE